MGWAYTIHTLHFSIASRNYQNVRRTCGKPLNENKKENTQKMDLTFYKYLLTLRTNILTSEIIITKLVKSLINMI